jgi:hypothetical protein
MSLNSIEVPALLPCPAYVFDPLVNVPKDLLSWRLEVRSNGVGPVTSIQVTTRAPRHAPLPIIDHDRALRGRNGLVSNPCFLMPPSKVTVFERPWNIYLVFVNVVPSFGVSAPQAYMKKSYT